ncbi:hypothetical protein [Actinomadura bangladeshensis]|nr:hypothetical protein [Actinomadura bangladeshensis]
MFAACAVCGAAVRAPVIVDAESGGESAFRLVIDVESDTVNRF